MTKKGVNFIVKVELYTQAIMFSIGETDKQLEKSLKKHGFKKIEELMKEIDSSNSYKGITCHYQGDIIVRIREDKYVNYSTLCHEMFHATSYLHKRVGIDLDHNSEESFAYTIGYISKVFFSKMNDYKIKIGHE